MNRTAHLPAREGQNLATYTFKIVVEPDEDRWHAYAPALEHFGAATWGYTREEALTHIREVLEMVVAELADEGEPIPSDLPASEEPLVTVTV
jgi:predicted RNase H-like HicB family nuclease